MESFQWNKHFETGQESVDKQHHVLVDLINHFGEMLTRMESVSMRDLEVVLNELAAYAQYHFQEEEGLMHLLGVDSRHIDQHVKLHLKFLQEVTRMAECIAQNADAAEPLLKFLIYWLAFHILGTDQSMARQIQSMEEGQSSEEAFLAEKVMKEGVIEPLLGALNVLFHQVSERNRELQELNLTLEEKVEERTRSLSEANLQLEEIALTDVLTDLPNRRHAMVRFAQEWTASIRDSSPLACMMIDADGFKQINDNYGHDAGDEVLRQLSRQLRYAVRTDDVVCRLGGDEFLIICPGTALEGALHVAETMRQEIEKMQVSFGTLGSWSGSISVGVAVRTDHMNNLEALIKAADEGVYTAKRNGRNRVGYGSAAVPRLGEVEH